MPTQSDIGRLKCLVFYVCLVCFSQRDFRFIKSTKLTKRLDCDRLAELHEADLLDDSTPNAAERQALDEAFAEFERDPSPGEPWRNVFSEIRKAR